MIAARRFSWGGIVATALLLATNAHGQTPATAATPTKPTRCKLIPQPTTRLSSDTLANGAQIAFVGGGVLLKCPERGITLQGDSAEQYPDRDYLIGHVIYDEPRLHLTSDFLTHYPTNERIVAAGNVDAKLPSGSSLKGPNAELQRVLLPIRPRRKLIATQRPTISVVEKDSTGKPMEPMTVVANSVLMDGDSLIYAGGDVVITRPNIGATADSAAIDQGKEIMQLMRNPQISGKKDRPFSLSGDLIDLYSKNRKLNRILSRAHAKAVSDSMTITSDTIDLRVKDDLLDHAYAWGGTANRARAVSPTQNMQADSLDILMPQQRVQLVRALRKAFADSKPDTLKFHVEKTDSIDWLRGDTIVAHFDTAATKDTSKTPNIKSLVSTGAAKAYYHLAPADTSLRLPAINYVVARQITIAFVDRKVSTVTNVDSISGVYIEPKADSTSKAKKAAPKSIVPLPPIKP